MSIDNKKVWLTAKTFHVVALALFSAAVFRFDSAAAQSVQGAVQGVGGDSSALQEILVTATRRESNLQETAIAISAVGGQELRSEQLNDVQSLASRVPGLQFGKSAAAVDVFIRGVGSDDVVPGGDTRIALYTDGIYQARSQAVLAGFFDIDRVEVLRGPQGTLYGRNATGGAINMNSREPTRDLDGYFAQTFGNYGEIASEGALGGGLTDTLSARVAFKTEDHSGYGINISNGEPVHDLKTRALRVKLKYEPSSSVTVHLTGNYFTESDHSGGFSFVGEGLPGVPPASVALGFVTPSNPQDAAGTGPLTHLDTYGGSIEVDWQLFDATKLVSLTGYQRFGHTLYTTDDDSTNFTGAPLSLVLFVEYGQQWTQEFRLSHSFGSLADIIVGAYYFTENHFAETRAPFSGIFFGAPTVVPLLQGYETTGVVNTNAPAAFTQANFHLTDKFGLTLGARYSHERETIGESYAFDLSRVYTPTSPFIPAASKEQSTSASKFDPLVTFDYKFTDGVYAYATYSRGFKSGGFNIGGLQPPFQPETLTDYEVGLKTELFDRKLRANISAFLYDYTNLQVATVVGVTIQTKNAASSRIKGLEAEITAIPVDNLRLSLNAAYLDAKYLNFSTEDATRPGLGVFDLAGNTLNFAPKLKINTELGYTFHPTIGEITPRVNVTWTDKVYFSPFNLSEESQRAWTQVDAFVTYLMRDSGWRADLYGKNLTNKNIILNDAISASFLGAVALGSWGPPRTYGVQITKKF